MANPMLIEEIKFYTKIVSNNVELPPTTEEVQGNIADLQASAVRSWYTGKMKLNPIRKDVFSMPVSWVDIPIDKVNMILANTKAESDGGTDVEIYDPVTNTRVTKRMYRSDRKYKIKIYVTGVFADLSFDFIEM